MLDGNRAAGVRLAGGEEIWCPAGHSFRRLLWQPGDPDAVGDRPGGRVATPGYRGTNRAGKVTVQATGESAGEGDQKLFAM